MGRGLGFTSALAAVAREGLTGLKERLDQLSCEHKKKAAWMSYRRRVWWIDWQRAKRGVLVAVVNPRGASTTCSTCSGKLAERGRRKMKRTVCGFEAGRDVVVIYNSQLKRVCEVWGNPAFSPLLLMPS